MVPNLCAKTRIKRLLVVVINRSRIRNIPDEWGLGALLQKLPENTVTLLMLLGIISNGNCTCFFEQI